VIVDEDHDHVSLWLWEGGAARQLTGDCTAEQRVEIQASGQLIGNIKAPRIVIAEGAVFRGNSDMGEGSAKARAAS